MIEDKTYEQTLIDLGNAAVNLALERNKFYQEQGQTLGTLRALYSDGLVAHLDLLSVRLEAAQEAYDSVLYRALQLRTSTRQV